MNKTKLYTIIFVVICFVGIGVGGIYKSFKPEPIPEVQDKIKEPEVIEETKDNFQKETDKKEEIQKDNSKSKNEVQTKPQKEETPQKPEIKPEEKPKKESAIPTEKVEDIPKVEQIPEIKLLKTTISVVGIDGVIVQGEIDIEEGKSVYDVLEKLCEDHHIEIKTSGFGKIIYVKGIHGLNEFDYGPQSGWMYQVNGVEPRIGAGSYKVKDGDLIEWIYKTTK